MGRWRAIAIRSALFVGLLVLLVGGCVELGILWDAPKRESARRAQCKFNLKLIHREIVEYHAQSGALPPDLDSLARADLLDHKTLLCPSALLLSSRQEVEYLYSPENWGTEEPVVQDAYENHLLWQNPLTRLFSLPLEPVRLGVYSDGTVKNLFER